MSSTEPSGAPAEASATTPAPDAAFPTFGSTRGSGLARGKRPTASNAAPAAASTGYTPTAIEVINAPREYQNPFAPANPEPAAPAETPAATSPASVEPAPAETVTPAAAAPVQPEAPAELNILEPERPKPVQAQTWESEGFRPAREPRAERPRREERAPEPQADEPVDIASIPPQFLYVRPGVTFVPTPRNWGGAPRERSERSDRPAHGSPERALETSVAAAPAKSGGFLGWLKSLFGGSAPAPVAAPGHSHGEHRHEGGHRRHRGGRGRGGEGGQRRSRGGRGRGDRGGYRPSEGSSQGGSI